MKFTWFHLMPWPHMPEDFRQKHRSVWVDLPSKMYQPELGHIAITSISTSSNMPRRWASTASA